MKDDGISEYDELYNPENLLAIIRDLKERVQRLELKDVIAVELSEISDELGDIYGGTIINEEVPTTAAPDITADVALTIDTSTLLVTCSPAGGQRVPLLDTDLTFTTYYLTAAITYDASGVTKDKYVDWYIYFDTSVDPPVLKLYPSVWTDDTTRSEAQTTKSGVVFLASDVRKRFIAVGKIPTADDPWIGGIGNVTWGGLVNGATPGHMAVLADVTGRVILDGGAPAAITPVADNWKSVFVFDDFVNCELPSGFLAWGAISGYIIYITNGYNLGEVYAGHPGFLRITNNNNGEDNGIYLHPIYANEFDLVQFVVLCDATIGATDGYLFGLLDASAGLGDTFAIDGTAEGIYFNAVYGDTNWRATTTDSGGTAQTDSGVAVNATHWFMLEIKRTATNTFAFYVNGSLVATHTTHISANILSPIICMYSNNGSQAFHIYVDYFGMQLAPLTQRWD
jgi:hypothetical protein